MKRTAFHRRLLAFGLIALLLLGAVPPRAEAISRTTGAPLMVSLGDSYSAGEGIPPFYGQEKGESAKLSDPDWAAHRSTQSWPGMLTLPGTVGTMAANRNVNWFFVADSGAKTYDLYGARTKPVKRIGYDGSCTLPAQLEVFNRFEEGEVDYVTLTLGGNDANFVDVVTASNVLNTFLNHGDLQNKLDETWTEFYKEGDGIRARLKQAYKDIWDSAGHQVTILVAGYPKLLDPDGCLLFDSPECHVIDRNVSQFNREIEKLVDECREGQKEDEDPFNIWFVSVESYFNGHEAYTDFPYLNEVTIPAQSEDLEIPGAVSAYSIHPNLSGARAYAQAVQAKIDELEGLDERQSEFSDFSIEGSWRSVGSYGFGQAQPGSIVTFDGEHCNFYSPNDTYEFYQSGGKWYLDTKNMLWGDVLTFEVQIIDYDHIRIYYSTTPTELERIITTEPVVTPPAETPGGGGTSPPQEPVAGDAVPPGTYVNYTFGVIRNAFTFYGDHQVTMNALGIQGDGTYVIQGGEIIITYTTTISSEPCVWRQPFSMSGDSIFISGDEFVRE